MEKVNTLEQTKEANKMTKKLTIMVAIAMCAVAAFARPGFGGPHGGFGGPRGGFHGGYRPAPIMHHGGYHHHHYSTWGRGGSHFWPGFVGGVVGGVLTSSIAPSPVVVTSPVVTAPVVTTPVYSTPVYTTQQVWVPGRYIDQVQANGTIVRVWVAGHYESRQVLVQ